MQILMQIESIGSSPENVTHDNIGYHRQGKLLKYARKIGITIKPIWYGNTRKNIITILFIKTASKYFFHISVSFWVRCVTVNQNQTSWIFRYNNKCINRLRSHERPNVADAHDEIHIANYWNNISYSTGLYIICN